MTDYSYIFSHSEQLFNNYNNKEELFTNFRNVKDIFGFIDNGDEPPYEEAIIKAKEIDENTYNKYIDSIKDRRLLGYGNSIPKYKYQHLDASHIMMSIIIFTKVNEPIKNIVEIGGGYANKLYLNRWQNFDKWYIIDLPHLCKLQEWCLKNHNISIDKYEILSAYDKTKWPSTNVDVVIGAHSLSEISMKNFIEYMECVIINSKYLLYSHNINCPSRELIDAKNNYIHTYFQKIYEIYTENNCVRTALYKKL
jgi:hypothetical protein